MWGSQRNLGNFLLKHFLEGRSFIQLAECLIDGEQIINSNNSFVNGPKYHGLVTDMILASNLLLHFIKESILELKWQGPCPCFHFLFLPQYLSGTEDLCGIKINKCTVMFTLNAATLYLPEVHVMVWPVDKQHAFYITFTESFHFSAATTSTLW